MTDHMPDDVSPFGRDLRAYTDALRPRYAVVRNVQGEWVLLSHDLVVQAALDDERFSSAVSSHLQVPNGLDGAEPPARTLKDPRRLQLTTAEIRLCRLPVFPRRVLALHPYELPEIISWPVGSGLPAYLDWVEGECAP